MDDRGAAIGERLWELRDERGWSQKGLANLSGVSHVTIVHLETGRIGNPRMPTLRRLARAFGMTVEEFAGDDAVNPLGYALRRRAEDWLREREARRDVLADFERWATDFLEGGATLETAREGAHRLAREMIVVRGEIEGFVRELRERFMDRSRARQVAADTADVRRSLLDELRRRYGRKQAALLSLEDALIVSEVERLSDERAFDALRSGSAA